LKRLPLIKSLTLWDVVAMTIVAVVSLRWISRSARLGAPSLILWVLACLAFFVPLALVLAELSSRHPQQVGSMRGPGARSARFTVSSAAGACG
jgi:glutamate:GABA antiporter